MTYEGNCHLGDLFKSRRQKGRAGLPVLSVTMNDGLVDRETLERKQDTNLAPEGHLLVKQNDIAYNMMRMWQGAFGLANTEGMVSPAYVVLNPGKRIDPVFASYMFKTPRVRYLLWAYSYGMTDDRLRLYYSDFAKIPVSLPNIKMQRAAGVCLAAWDAAIGVTERLLANSRKQKRALIENLVSAERSRSGAGWSEVSLKQVASIVVSSVNKRQELGERRVRLCNYTDVYHHDHITSDLCFMEATATEREIAKFSVRLGDVLITKDSETPDDIAVPACVAEEIQDLVCGYHLAIIRPDQERIHPEFLTGFFLLHRTRAYFSSRANGATRFGLPLSALEDVRLMLPDIAEQRFIAQVISTNNKEIARLACSLKALKAEKQALMQELMTVKRHLRGSAEALPA